MSDFKSFFKKGDKIKFIEATDEQVKWGSNTDPRQLLSTDKIYTVKELEVHSWHTKIYLEEVEGKFNSVHFESIAVPILQEQPKPENDMSAKEFYNSLFNLDFMTEEERETIYTATELYAKGKLRVYSLNPSHIEEQKPVQEKKTAEEMLEKYPHVTGTMEGDNSRLISEQRGMAIMAEQGLLELNRKIYESAIDELFDWLAYEDLLPEKIDYLKEKYYEFKNSK